jgi:hypothetical protein
MTSSTNTTMNPGRRAFLTNVAAAAVTASVTSPAIAGCRDPILDAIVPLTQFAPPNRN